MIKLETRRGVLYAIDENGNHIASFWDFDDMDAIKKFCDNPTWTIKKVKRLTPIVTVTIDGKKKIAGKIGGNQNEKATIDTGRHLYEASWKSVRDALKSRKPLELTSNQEVKKP